MKSTAGSAVTRTLEVVFLVLLLVAEVTFLMGGWWAWLAYTRTHA